MKKMWGAYVAEDPARSPLRTLDRTGQLMKTRRTLKRLTWTQAAWIMCACIVGCGGGETAEEVSMPVYVDTQTSVSETDLGYRVELTRFATVVSDLRFVNYGARQSTSLEPLLEWLVPTAHAHPGHVQSGDTLGTLPGSFEVDFLRAERVGVAQLLVGSYDAIDSGLGRLSPNDSPDQATDPSMLLTGIASRGATQIPFEVRVLAPDERELIGIPFEVEVVNNDPRAVVLRFAMNEPFRSERHVFDGIDFAAMPEPLVLSALADDNSTVDAFFEVQRRLLSHDYFQATLEERPND